MELFLWLFKILPILNAAACAFMKRFFMFSQALKALLAILK